MSLVPHVIVFNDNEKRGNVLKGILESQGCQTEVVSQKVVEIPSFDLGSYLKAKNPDVIAMDVPYPCDINGGKYTEWRQEYSIKTPVILTTPNPKVVKDVIGPDGDEIVVKDRLSVPELSSALRRIRMKRQEKREEEKGKELEFAVVRERAI